MNLSECSAWLNRSALNEISQSIYTQPECFSNVFLGPWKKIIIKADKVTEEEERQYFLISTNICALCQEWAFRKSTTYSLLHSFSERDPAKDTKEKKNYIDTEKVSKLLSKR